MPICARWRWPIPMYIKGIILRGFQTYDFFAKHVLADISYVCKPCNPWQPACKHIIVCKPCARNHIICLRGITYTHLGTHAKRALASIQFTISSSGVLAHQNDGMTPSCYSNFGQRREVHITPSFNFPGRGIWQFSLVSVSPWSAPSFYKPNYCTRGMCTKAWYKDQVLARYIDNNVCAKW